MAHQSNYGNYIVYVDESGDHGLETINPNYPVFVLVFCIFKVSDYTQQITPAIQEFKFKHFGHDMIILHEREIHKSKGEFSFLLNKERRESFMNGLSDLVESAPFTIITTVIHKERLAKSPETENPYQIALKFGLEQICSYLTEQDCHDKVTHVIVESRGKKEDAELELDFRRICDGDNRTQQSFLFRVVFANKQANSCGLQLADLIARPVGRKALKSDQPNRAFDIIEKKILKSPEGEMEGWGLKTYP